MRALAAGSGFSGEAAGLTLGPEGGLPMCRWGWHKHRGGRTPRWFGLVGVKRMGKGIVGNKDSKSKVRSDHRDPECQVSESGLYFIGNELATEGFSYRAITYS